jgi:hypothetical protein
MLCLFICKEKNKLMTSGMPISPTASLYLITLIDKKQMKYVLNGIWLASFGTQLAKFYNFVKREQMF